ncbi:uncharacterized protein DUF2272 [Tepidamorphus gemmatus]|jgi:hypothetical protein|uniref:Uncharacterized protein DUF2272 n=1 Tax=Tepidamorphus gemmatus TaxID=747076 RepID=A0A4R3M692_9HYPH|nr:DUF2272 domain-containing protein [Tepidamorphus gemmatus]TCT08830.1 uncharacterized protein DUF2272 [Tepidamorphus gemmatus]
MSKFTSRLRQACLDELTRFANGKEYNDPFAAYVGEYWKAIGINHLDGKTTVGGIRPAWSAAFVSFCVKTAGAGDRFMYTQAHCHYVARAMDAAEKASSSFGYVARRPESYTPRVGDIVCAGRLYAKQYTYDMARMQYVADSFYPSHGDIIVDISDGHAAAVGGNLSDSVQRKRLALTPEGYLEPLTAGGKTYPWIAVLECRM